LTPYLEIGGDYREVAPGVYLIELPLPFSLGLVNVYLLRLREGFLLVDCGMETEPCFQALDRALEGLGVVWPDIRQLLLTHIHPDHMGLTRRLLQLTPASLLLHKDDHDLLQRISDEVPFGAWQATVLARAGVPADMAARIVDAFAPVQTAFYRVNPNIALSGGEVLTTAGGALEVLHTPGHSAGHVCLYDREQRLLFSGDHLLEHISPNIGWQPARDTLAEFLTSLDEIAQLDVELILPSHGAPFRGHREWISRTKQHHRDRCNRIVALLGKAGKTANEVVAALWEQRLSPFHYRFAVFEVLAHLEYLRRLGQILSFSRDGMDCWAGR
jgi:glyoxylase-like metal-dependent hydrolase (beta-lactamase superfamily II)